MAKVIGILSLKGGVGKTSVVSSLGDALSGFGKKVLLVDANFSAPTLGLHWNVIEPDITLHHVLARRANIKDSVYKMGNVDVIPSSIFHNIEINPMILKDKLNQIKKEYDFIILDSAPSMSQETLSVILASNSLIFVTTPDRPTLSNTLKIINLARDRGSTVDGLILNKVHDKDFEISIDDIEKTIESPVLAVIPYDTEVLRALSVFTPSTSFKPKSEGSIEFKKLAGVLTGTKYKTFSFKNLFNLAPERQEVNRELFYRSVFKR